MANPKIVLMTGGSAGIGLATAERLARDPDQRFLVVATVISFAEKGDLVAAVGDALDKTLFIKELDVTKDEQITTVVDEVIKEYGRIDILLNIAGIAISGNVDTTTRARMELIFNINTFGVIRITQAVMPHMKKEKAGKIITITSMAGRIGTPMLEIYCATKFATEGFLESIAPVARQFNIRVSMVEPTFIQTGLVTDIYSGVDAMIADDSINEIDRECARSWQEFAKKTPSFKPPNVVATLMEIIEAKEPVLRYQVPSAIFKTPLHDMFCDPTGEKLVARNVETLTFKETLKLPETA